uniref:Ion transport domain-containing protein n=1 Tax=Amphimedon queenslandica TaxID=400682 RepID=A0A1X7TRR7_AMPQE
KNVLYALVKILYVHSKIQEMFPVFLSLFLIIVCATA